MANRFYRARIKEKVETARQRFAAASELDHPGLKGRAREVAVSEIIQPLLFDHLAIGSGAIVDYLGSQSAETDCIIYSRRFIPPLMLSGDSGIFPLDATLVVLEVKSTLTAPELEDTLRKTRRFWGLRYATYEQKTTSEGETTISFHTAMPALFAFSSDLSGDGKTELDRYRELDPEADERPQLTALCVLGRGCWYFWRDSREWRFYPPTEDFDEIIDFSAILLDTAMMTASSRLPPRISGYLVSHQGFDSNGVVIRHSPPKGDGP